MKRDMDLIRRIVLETADLKFGDTLEELPGVPQDELFEHVVLLKEAGLVEAIAETYLDNSPGPLFIQRLTWDGQNFADEIKSDTLWRKAKETVLKPGASFTIAVLRDWLKHEITQGFPALR